MAECLEDQFQPNESDKSFALAPASESLLTNTTEMSKAFAELKAGEAPNSNDVPNMYLRNLPRKAVIFLKKAFNGSSCGNTIQQCGNRPA